VLPQFGLPRTLPDDAGLGLCARRLGRSAVGQVRAVPTAHRPSSGTRHRQWAGAHLLVPRCHLAWWSASGDVDVRADIGHCGTADTSSYGVDVFHAAGHRRRSRRQLDLREGCSAILGAVKAVAHGLGCAVSGLSRVGAAATIRPWWT
jgi:hypothetical protein